MAPHVVIGKRCMQGILVGVCRGDGSEVRARSGPMRVTQHANAHAATAVCTQMEGLNQVSVGGTGTHTW